MKEYTTFEVHIVASRRGRYSLLVKGLGGDAQSTFTPPTNTPAYQALADRLGRFDTDETMLVELGQTLFQAVFQGKIKEIYTRTQGMLRSGQGLRLILNIPLEETAIAALPWEFLYDPDRGPLALLDTPITRYFARSMPIPTLETKLPLKVLLTAAQTPPPAVVERELAIAKTALEGLGQHIHIVVEPHLTRSTLQQRMRETFHIWHFVGHGGFDTAGINGRLIFEDATGDADPVTARELGILLNRSSVRLIVLNACEGAQLAADPFRSLAPAMIVAQVPAVVAMQSSISNEATRAFASEFYRALAEGLPIDACVTEGRKAVMNVTGLRSPDWGIPVVYTRAPDGKLFDLPERQRMQARVFISYERSVEPDRTLAKQLRDAIAGIGGSVFLDQEKEVNVAWPGEVRRQIESSDVLVVLLSKTSVYNEIVAAEVQHASQGRLLPVRVDYADVLPHPLNRYLDGLPYAVWRSAADSGSMIQQVIDAISGQGALLTAEPPQSPAISPSPAAPRPYADPRFIDSLDVPYGAVALDSEFYIERDGDRLLSRALRKSSGTTTIIRAARQTGKTSLLIRGCAQARQQGYSVASIDLQLVDESRLQSMDTFLRYLSEAMLRRLGLDPAHVTQAWQGALDPASKTTYLMEDILPKVGARMLLALDEADRLLNVPFRDSFFGMVRSWDNSRASDPIWKKLSIAMVISTEPHLFIQDVNQSPFNVGEKIRLEDFNPSQVQELNQRYRLPLGEDELPALIEFLNGHPFLTRKALYTIVTERLSLTHLIQIATTEHSPFSDHLQRYLWLLHDQPELKEALNQAIRRGACPDDISYYRLFQAGLLTGSKNSCRCRCRLYEEYFKDKLR